MDKENIVACGDCGRKLGIILDTLTEYPVKVKVLCPCGGSSYNIKRSFKVIFDPSPGLIADDVRFDDTKEPILMIIECKPTKKEK